MTQFIVHAPAKINLTLDILSTMPDGYHELETLMQTVDLEDELTFDLNKSNNNESKITIQCVNKDEYSEFPEDNSNLIAKSFYTFLNALDKPIPITASVSIKKNIPISAGLAGGSSNAASTLIALNKYLDNHFTQDKLMQLARELGSDIPFLLKGGTCIGRDRGDNLEEITNSNTFVFCLIKIKELSLSTAYVYKAFDNYKGKITKPNLNNAIQGLQKNNLNQTINSLANVFEPVVCSEFPQIQELKNKLLSLNVWCCHLTGSGPTLFSIVSNREMAHSVRRNLFDQYGYKNEDKSMLDFWICEPIKYGTYIAQKK